MIFHKKIQRALLLPPLPHNACVHKAPLKITIRGALNGD